MLLAVWLCAYQTGRYHSIIVRLMIIDQTRFWFYTCLARQ